MPTVIPEDGTGLPNANSFASVAEADLYFADHPYYADAWAALTVPSRESFLIAATAQLDALITWRGVIVSSTQALGWPRVGVVDDEGRIIPDNVVPQRLRNATFEMAFYLSRGNRYEVATGAAVESLKIDVIELQFAGSTKVTPVPAPALYALRGLGDYAFGSRVRRVMVG